MPVNDLSQSYTWVPIYQELAKKLLEYKNDRKRLLNILSTVYEKIGKRFPDLTSKGIPPADIDPFTVFGFFNKMKQSQSTRLSILNQLKEEFHLSSASPSDFKGIPLVHGLQVNYVGNVNDRKDEDIAYLWDFFEIALEHASQPTETTQKLFEHYFNLAIKLQYTKLVKATRGLFWIAPDSYLVLDNNTKNYILNSDRRLVNLSNKDIDNLTGKEYLKLLEEIKEKIQGLEDIHSFLDLSSKAFDNKKKSDIDNKKRYWLYKPDKETDCLKNGYMSLFFKSGDLSKCKSLEDVKKAWLRNNTNVDKEPKEEIEALWKLSHIIKEGDVVYAKREKNIIARGVVTATGYRYLSNDMHVCFVDWQQKEIKNPRPKIRKILGEITETQFINTLESEFNETESLKSEDPSPYTDKNFLDDVYMEENDYKRLKAALKLKKNVVLEGAPGVGKTYIAKRLAYAMMGTKDDSRVEMVQFHQSYSYEDFVMGYRPTPEGGFEIHFGAFYNFCKKAETDPDKDYFFIIDEINRGNLSKIFGEMFMLLENDKRGQPVQLLYSGKSFSIPKNLYVIGTANTADRSLAMIDYALRRRFTFQRIEPAFKNENFKKYIGEKSTVLNSLIENVEKLNNEMITKDASLGSGFCIGHSYFTNLEKTNELEETLKNIVEFELIPLLTEYCFDQPYKLKKWIKTLAENVLSEERVKKLTEGLSDTNS